MWKAQKNNYFWLFGCFRIELKYFNENRRKSVSQATILPPSDKFREIEGFIKELQKANEIQNL